MVTSFSPFGHRHRLSPGIAGAEAWRFTETVLGEAEGQIASRAVLQPDRDSGTKERRSYESNSPREGGFEFAMDRP